MDERIGLSADDSLIFTILCICMGTGLLKMILRIIKGERK